ncbi:MAG: hypothetical protein MI923_01580 [Phycisphaerales bacterium]|nr:hypothetical protein [Phycisphaerales bacterium]
MDSATIENEYWTEGTFVALRVKCKCGKTLKISSKHADRKLGCPHCKHAFRISAAKFKNAEANSVARSPAPRPPPPPAPRPVPLQASPTPANLDDELLGELSGVFDHSQSDILTALDADATSAPTSAAPAAIAVEAAKPVSLSYARDGRPERPRGSSLRDTVQGPQRGFWSDAFMSFIYPVQSGGNAITLVIILFLSAIREFLPDSGCMSLIPSLIIFGWLAALYFSVIQETSTGSDDLPGIRMEGGFLDDIIKPALKFIGAIAVVLAPSVFLAIALSSGLLPSSMGWMIPIWTAAGIFLLPISLLLFAFDALGTIYRLDLIFSTIFRTILPYLAIWLMLLIIGTGLMITNLGEMILDAFKIDFLTSVSLTNVGLGFAIMLLLNIFSTYLMIVAMRVIGLYYLHFKKRFTIVME